MRAILLDPEARSRCRPRPPRGKLREPVLRFVAWARAFDADLGGRRLGLGNTARPGDRLGQSPLRSPSVFNFFRPGYVPPNTAIGAQALVAPEFQITNETSVAGYVNYMQRVRARVGAGDVDGELRATGSPRPTTRRRWWRESTCCSPPASCRRRRRRRCVNAVATIAAATDTARLQPRLRGDAAVPVRARVSGRSSRRRDDHDATIPPRIPAARIGALGSPAAAAPWALNLAAIGEAAAQSATDYKALVCVFLYGGNDYANTVMPYDTSRLQRLPGDAPDPRHAARRSSRPRR